MADNQLYLTKGQRDAVLDGSDTVDMTDNQMTETGGPAGGGTYYTGAVIDDETQKNPFKNNILGEKGLRAFLWKRGFFDHESKLNENIEKGLLKITQPGKDAADEMFGYMDGVEDETMNKNGGVMSFRPGGKTKLKKKNLEIPDRGRGSSYVPKPKKELQEETKGTARDNYIANQTFRAFKDKEAKENKLRLKRDLIESGRDVDFEEIVDFRNESGISSSEYRDLLDTVKTRAGDKNFYDAGFTKGPGQIIENYIKGGGVLGSIFRSIFGNAKDMGEDLGVAAFDKVSSFKDYLSNFGKGDEEVIEERESIHYPAESGEIGEDKNLAVPIDSIYGDYSPIYDKPLSGSGKPITQSSIDNLSDRELYEIRSKYQGRGGFDKMNSSDMLLQHDINPEWAKQRNFGYRRPLPIMPQSEFNKIPPDARQHVKNNLDEVGYFDRFNNYPQYFEGMANGGGLFPQMTPQDPLMNSFNKNPLSVLQRDNGGVTRQQYEQQYAPKTAAQALGIVDIHDEEGIMGV